MDCLHSEGKRVCSLFLFSAALRDALVLRFVLGVALPVTSTALARGTLHLRAEKVPCLGLRDEGDGNDWLGAPREQLPARGKGLPHPTERQAQARKGRMGL